ACPEGEKLGGKRRLPDTLLSYGAARQCPAKRARRPEAIELAGGVGHAGRSSRALPRPRPRAFPPPALMGKLANLASSNFAGHKSSITMDLCLGTSVSSFSRALPKLWPRPTVASFTTILAQASRSRGPAVIGQQIDSTL